MAVYLVDSHGPYTRHPDIDSSPFARSTLGNYDAELAWTDETIRGIVEVVRSRRMIWDNTIVIVTADHGEEFNEHGGNSHARTCHDEVTHVPLLVRIPGVEPQRIDTRVALVDVVPTLLELTGNKTSLESLSGQSLLIPVLARDRLTPNRPIFCAMASVSDKKGTFFRRSVRQDHWSLHQDVRDGAIKLFDIQSDRSEQNDLADEAEHRPVVERMTALLAASLTGNLRDHEQMAKESKP
jgi:arylsulfatase A-like enzyme